MANKLGTKAEIGGPITPFLIVTDLCSYAVPSKAFLEEQAEREQAERERAEREREARELAKKPKHQSYEDFPPISTSE